IGACATDADDSSGGPRFDAPGLRAFLDGYAAVDLQSISRVVSSTLLQGIHKQDLLERASEIELMAESVDVLTAADASYVISSNWSTAMLDATLNSDSGRQKIKIITNDLEMDAATGVTTGAIQLRVQSPGDKAQWVQRIRKDEALNSTHNDKSHQLGREQRREPLVVFVGDSANDLLAMVEADVAVALVSSTESSFIKLVKQFGAEVEPISSRRSLAECARDSEEAKAQGRQLLFTATTWAEISACAFK
ncbi:Had-like domain, partial [Globisporangium polare]